MVNALQMSDAAFITANYYYKTGIINGAIDRSRFKFWPFMY